MKLRSWRLHLLVALGLLAPGVVIFWPFLFGDAVLLYRDIGRDPLSSYYTNFVHLSNYLRTDGFPSWSFHIGMGQDLAYATGFLFWEPVTWLPARFIAQALVYQHLLKVAVAGLLFFRFLRMRGTPISAATLGSLLIAFSSYLTLGSCWYLPAEELLAFTLVLLGAETVLQRGPWVLLLLSVALAGTINPFYLYLCALFLCAYVPCRLIAQTGWQPGVIFKRSLIVGIIALLGAAFGAVITLPSLNVILNSPRGSGTTSSFAVLSSLPLFGFESASHYVSALLRPFANDLAGTGDSFRGWQNYLEAPQTYCGLVCLLLLPQAIVGGKLRPRILVLLFFLWLIIPTIFPWFRYLFWLVRGDYYRTYSLFCVLGTITVVVAVLRRYLERGPFSMWLLVVWGGILIGALFLPIDQIQTVIDPQLRIAVTIYLALDMAILVTGRLANKASLAIYCTLAVTAVELVHFDGITVSQRGFVKKTELVNGIAAKGESVRAIADLKRDDNSFFRFTRLRSGEQGAELDSNEAMLLSYYATSSYGSFNDSNYLRFLAAVGALAGNYETDIRSTVGLTGDFILSMFAAEKYALVEDPLPFQRAAQYEFMTRYGDSHLFRNAFFLPLGLTYSRYLPEGEFLRLPPDGKAQALLAVAVLDDSSLASFGNLPRTNPAELEKELAASSFPIIVGQRRATALQLTSFAQSRIEGDLRMDKDGVLVLQTPFNPGWKAFQDGQPVATGRVDAGLLGLPVKAGQHKIVLQYRNPWLWTGACLTALALVLVVAARWRWPRLVTVAD
jgi:uncharacterized membrane protein YfhO